MKQSRNAYRNLVGRLEGKIGRSRSRREDNIKMDLKVVVVILGNEWTSLKIRTNGVQAIITFKVMQLLFCILTFFMLDII